jgi:hypothetical protein
LTGEYRPREPEQSLVYHVLQENLETYLARQKEKGRDVPKFVERELRGVLECGVLACGFLRLQCEVCKEEKLLPFSCKGRAACSPCCGRRMADTAAHLVEHVFPRVPVRQWVLSLPFSLRYRLAYSPSLLTAVYGIFARTVFSFLRKMGRDYGIHQTQCGAVSFVQRYGGSLNLNVHIHMACIDGVYAPDVDGRPRFYKLRRLEDKDILQLTQTLASQITALVQRRFGESCGEEDPLSREQPWLAGLYAASVSNRIADGPNAGRRVMLAGDRIDPEGIEERSSPLCASVDGFNLHAAVVVPQNDRVRLEQLLRYAARPPFAIDRLEQLPDGRLSYRLKTPWRDGTTHAVFTPLEFIERVAALIPTPRAHLIRFSGVLGPAAKWRAQIVPSDVESNSDTAVATPSSEEVNRAPSESKSPDKEKPAAEESQKKKTKRKNYTWAELIQRVFATDATVCGKCGGKLRLISPIHPPVATRKILDHLGLPSRPPPLAPPARTAELDGTFDWA